MDECESREPVPALHNKIHGTIFKTGIGCRPYLLKALVTGDCHGMVANKASAIAVRFRRGTSARQPGMD
jgi:hypothetical protein